MKLRDFDFVEAAAVRRAVVAAGDIRGDVGFQNDINGLLARLEGNNPPLRALGWIREPVDVPVMFSRPMVQATLRVLKGGGIRANVVGESAPREAIARRA
jgi:hypothetical protein